MKFNHITVGRKTGIMEGETEEPTQATTLNGSLNSDIHAENTLFRSSSGFEVWKWIDHLSEIN